MTEEFEPVGPYYLTLYCENVDAAEVVDTIYVDGFKTEADAWDACNGISATTTEALDEFGEPVTVCGQTILQATITKAVGADFPHSFAA